MSPFQQVCSTAAVFAPAVALSSVTGDEPIRYLTIVLAALTAAVLLAPASRAARRFAVASAYSAESSGPTNGCDGSPLHDADLSFASFLVPCGARVRFCLGRRCVTGVRRDSGPYTLGRSFDLNLGIVRALGFPTCLAFGVRTVSWSRIA